MPAITIQKVHDVPVRTIEIDEHKECHLSVLVELDFSRGINSEYGGCKTSLRWWDTYREEFASVGRYFWFDRSFGPKGKMAADGLYEDVGVTAQITLKDYFEAKKAGHGHCPNDMWYAIRIGLHGGPYAHDVWDSDRLLTAGKGLATVEKNMATLSARLGRPTNLPDFIWRTALAMKARVFVRRSEKAMKSHSCATPFSDVDADGLRYALRSMVHEATEAKYGTAAA